MKVGQKDSNWKCASSCITAYLLQGLFYSSGILPDRKARQVGYLVDVDWLCTASGLELAGKFGNHTSEWHALHSVKVALGLERVL